MGNERSDIDGRDIIVDCGVRDDIPQFICDSLYECAMEFSKKVGTSNGPTALYYALISTLNKHRMRDVT